MRAALPILFLVPFAAGLVEPSCVPEVPGESCREAWTSGPTGTVWAAASSPDSATLYTSGGLDDGAPLLLGFVNATDAATGAHVWSRDLVASADLWTFGSRVIATADGELAVSLWIAGKFDEALGRDRIFEAHVTAFDAATGETRWQVDVPGAISYGHVREAPDGGILLLLDPWAGPAFVARLDEATGAERWRTALPQGPHDLAVDLRVAGERVVVAGYTYRDLATTDDRDVLVTALDVGTGGLAWHREWGDPAASEAAWTLAADAAGARVTVAGEAFHADGSVRWMIATLDVRTGAHVWERSWTGGGKTYVLGGIGVTPDGSRVVAGGIDTIDPTTVVTRGLLLHWQHTVIALDGATGEDVWVGRYSGPQRQNDLLFALALSADGRRVYGTGESLAPGSTGTGHTYDVITTSWDVADGRLAWAARWSPEAFGHHSAQRILVTSDGARVVVPALRVGALGVATALVAYDVAAQESAGRGSILAEVPGGGDGDGALGPAAPRARDRGALAPGLGGAIGALGLQPASSSPAAKIPWMNV